MAHDFYKGAGKAVVVRIKHGDTAHSRTSAVSLVTEELLEPMDPDDPGRITDALRDPDIYTDDGKAVFSMRLSKDEDLYGLGLQLLSHRQRGTEKILRTNADPICDNGFAHMASPFLVSTDGYGLLFNTHGCPGIDIGLTDRGRLKYVSPDGTLDLFYIIGDSPLDAIRTYHKLTGLQKMPPAWGLGLLYRGHQHWSQEQILDFARTFREKQVPCDVIGLEPGWQTRRYPCSYIWDRKLFPAPEALVEQLHSQGFRLNLWEHAWVSPEAPFAADIKAFSGDKPSMGGLAPDFTLPEARSLFGSHHSETLVNIGVDGFKLDECDGSDNTGGWFFPDDTHFPSGLTGSEMHNIYGFLYQDLMHNIYAEKNLRALHLCRGSWGSSKGNPTVAYSDLYDFREFVRGVVNSGFCGNLWSPEIRSTDNPKDFIRRTQVMFFSHLPQVNAWASGVTPWDLGEEVCGIFRKYANLRMLMLPYIYSSFRLSFETGIPVIRALSIDYPDDPMVRDIDDEYMFGNSLLVAPVVDTEAAERSLYLPSGTWYDYWTGAVFQGPASIVYPAPLDVLPLFVKAGGIISYGSLHQHACPDVFDDIGIVCYSGGSSESLIYADDLVSLDYARGVYHRRPIAFSSDGESFSFTLGCPEGDYKGKAPKTYTIEIRNISDQTVSGLKRVADAKGHSDTSCYSYDRLKRTIAIRLLSNGFSDEIRLEGVKRHGGSDCILGWESVWNRIRNLPTTAAGETVKGKIMDVFDGIEAGSVPYSDAECERLLGGLAMKLADHLEPGQIKMLMDVKSDVMTQNDRVQPRSCRVITEVTNPKYNLPFDAEVKLEVSRGWEVNEETSRAILYPGTRRRFVAELTPAGSELPAGLCVKAVTSFRYGSMVWSAESTKVWGGYITGWLIGSADDTGSMSMPPTGDHGSLASLAPFKTEGPEAKTVLPEGTKIAVCRIWSPVGCKGRVELGVNGPTEVYWNGTSLGKGMPRSEGPKPSQHIFSIQIPSGWSIIALLFDEKEALEHRVPAFYLRIAGEWGQTLDRLVPSLDLH